MPCHGSGGKAILASYREASVRMNALGIRSIVLPFFAAWALLLGCTAHVSGSIGSHHSAPTPDADCLQICLVREAGDAGQVAEHAVAPPLQVHAAAASQPTLGPVRIDGSGFIAAPAAPVGSLKRYQLTRSYRI